MSITAYKDHPLSELLPLMDEVEIAEMAGDIQQHGQRAPITLYENKILDGRNRYRACKIANVEPKVRHFTSGDALSFIVSANVFRRHLTTSQRAVVAAKLANLSNGRKTTSKTTSANLPRSERLVTQAEAAKELNVSTRQVRAAKEVLRDALKKEIKAIERGEKTVHEVAIAVKKKAEPKERTLDKTNYPIPEGVLEDWDRAETKAREWLSKISQVRSELKSDFDDQDVILANITNTTLADLNNAYTSLKCIQPYAVCASCQGVQRKKCGLCKGRGFLDHFAWKSYVPEETRKMREEKK